jgi:TrmH family RNA methyltransferase
LGRDDLKNISRLVSTPEVIALAHIPPQVNLAKPSGLILALDTIQDPGNMGTIIRIADWYGISTILCSEGCVDVFNPKVINATMGSFLRVNLLTANLADWFGQHRDVPVYGAMLEGESIYDLEPEKDAVLLVGNEGAGISPELQKHITRKISIPRRGGAESLNAGVATGIIVDAWARCFWR